MFPQDLEAILTGLTAFVIVSKFGKPEKQPQNCDFTTSKFWGLKQNREKSSNTNLESILVSGLAIDCRGLNHGSIYIYYGIYIYTIDEFFMVNPSKKPWIMNFVRSVSDIGGSSE